MIHGRGMLKVGGKRGLSGYNYLPQLPFQHVVIMIVKTYYRPPAQMHSP
jgi:hypothetical protein